MEALAVITKAIVRKLAGAFIFSKEVYVDMTNYERIKAGSIDGLAGLLYEIRFKCGMCKGCGNIKSLDMMLYECPFGHGIIGAEGTKERCNWNDDDIKNWLLKESE